MIERELVGRLNHDGLTTLTERFLQPQAARYVRRDLSTQLILQIVTPDGDTYDWTIPAKTMVMMYLKSCGKLQFWLGVGDKVKLIDVTVEDGNVFAPKDHGMRLAIPPKPEDEKYADHQGLVTA